MLGREMVIALRARLTWLQAGLAALLVGHGFVLAVDLYSAASRSARNNLLLARELDPLAGVVRPTLGGLYLSLALLGPLVAARLIAVEKERRTLGSLLLRTAAPIRLLLFKFAAAAAAVGLQLAAPIVLFGLWIVVGGHLSFPETAVALLGYLCYAALVAALATAAAAWTQSLAQAATLAILTIASSWAIDASEGFAALAWLGRALDWSATTHLAPMERGTLAIGACLWMAAISIGALAVAVIGLRFDLSPWRRRLLLAGAVASAALLCALAHRVRWGFDVTEAKRVSLPKEVVVALAAVPAPLSVEVWLDRDDARRQQFERDALAKLRLARPSVIIRTPTDDERSPVEGERDPSYGRIVIRVGANSRETRSTSPDEIVRTIFEAAGLPQPDFAEVEYPGYPIVVEGGRRSVLVGAAYAGIPLLLWSVGWLCTRSPRRKT